MSLHPKRLRTMNEQKEDIVFLSTHHWPQRQDSFAASSSCGDGYVSASSDLSPRKSEALSVAGPKTSKIFPRILHALTRRGDNVVEGQSAYHNRKRLHLENKGQEKEYSFKHLPAYAPSTLSVPTNIVLGRANPSTPSQRRRTKTGRRNLIMSALRSQQNSNHDKGTLPASKRAKRVVDASEASETLQMDDNFTFTGLPESSAIKTLAVEVPKAVNTIKSDASNSHLSWTKSLDASWVSRHSALRQQQHAKGWNCRMASRLLLLKAFVGVACFLLVCYIVNSISSSAQSTIAVAPQDPLGLVGCLKLVVAWVALGKFQTYWTRSRRANNIHAHSLRGAPVLW